MEQLPSSAKPQHPLQADKTPSFHQGDGSELVYGHALQELILWRILTHFIPVLYIVWLLTFLRKQQRCFSFFTL